MSGKSPRIASLITGGAGFIGSHVAQNCLADGHTVVILDDLSGGFLDNIPSGAIFVEGSILDSALVKQLFSDYHFTFVYHLGAYAAEGLSHFIRQFNYLNNLTGSVNLINASVNSGSVERFIFTSSIAVYGSEQLPMSEEIPPHPEDPYGISKYAVELDLEAAHQLFGLNYTIFRPHNVYGEHQNTGDRYRNVIGIFINQVLKNEPMTIFGDGSQSRAFSYIDQVAKVIAGCIHIKASENKIFNIGSDEIHSVLEVAHLVAEALGVKPDIRFLDARKEVLHAFSSHQRLEDVFGKQDSVPLSEGITRMADWAKREVHGNRAVLAR